jgi:formylglycine-generating enzyme required for sulfatase activity
MILIPLTAMGETVDPDEHPEHAYLDAFYLDKYEITNALYKECIRRAYSPKSLNFETRLKYFYNP